MARWIAYFEDDPRMMDVRSQFSAAHLEYLDRHKDKILIGGPLREIADGPVLGGLWVLEVASRDEAQALIDEDPFFRTGFRRCRLLAWGKAFKDRDVVL